LYLALVLLLNIVMSLTFTEYLYWALIKAKKIKPQSHKVTK